MKESGKTRNLRNLSGFLLLFLLGFMTGGCGKKSSDAVPRPVAYPRIERSYDTVYTCVYEPLNIELNGNAEIERLSEENGSGGFRVRYPDYNADLVCSYIRVRGRSDLEKVLAKRMQRVALDMGESVPDVFRFTDLACMNHAVLYYCLRDCVTPVHFIATDSLTQVVSGTVVFDRIENFDSIAPIVDYLCYDMSHLVTHLDFKRKSDGN